MRRNVLLLVFALAPLPVLAQNIVSAKAGLIHLAEGEVLLNDALFEQNNQNQFESMKTGDVLATQEGRAEILLHPGGYLRLAENSSFKLEGATYEDTRLKLVRGSALIEVDALDKTVSLRIEVQGRVINIRKRGLYEFNVTGPGVARVHDGELSVKAVDGLAMTVKEGQELVFTALTPTKFDKEDTTALYRWGARRARSLAMAATSIRPLNTRSINSWMWSPNCTCYFYYLTDGMYSPYRQYIYLQPVIYNTSLNTDTGFNIGSTTSPVSAAAQASASVTAGDSSGASAMPAASAAPAASSNTADRRR